MQGYSLHDVAVGVYCRLYGCLGRVGVGSGRWLLEDQTMGTAHQESVDEVTVEVFERTALAVVVVECSQKTGSAEIVVDTVHAYGYPETTRVAAEWAFFGGTHTGPLVVPAYPFFGGTSL